MKYLTDKKKLSTLKRERADKIRQIFGCLSLEPEVCPICAKITELVLLGKKK